ncbi:hypothetical protein HBB16_05315 [Pseudonocardia sp. MCCB 268]|nr:hypothetical protein [Pseudonocardia cytotoxica]
MKRWGTLGDAGQGVPDNAEVVVGERTTERRRCPTHDTATLRGSDPVVARTDVGLRMHSSATAEISPKSPIGTAGCTVAGESHPTIESVLAEWPSTDSGPSPPTVPAGRIRGGAVPRRAAVRTLETVELHAGLRPARVEWHGRRRAIAGRRAHEAAQAFGARRIVLDTG